MKILDPRFGLFVGDSDSCALERLKYGEKLPGKGFSPEDLSLILSPSGWRGVFASSEDDDSGEPAERMLWAALSMAGAAAEYFSAFSGKPTILVGCDARPTGPAICEIFLRVFLALGIPCEYLFITPAPEIMAAARNRRECGGFCYISASHNPIGHNGVKLGRQDGGVLPGIEAAPIIQRVKDILASPEELDRLRESADGADSRNLEALFQQVSDAQNRASRIYSAFSGSVVFDTYPDKKSALQESLKKMPLGVVGELNGSARGVSIDREFMEDLGLRVRLYNSRPGEILHAILPEGESLEPCSMLLQESWREDPAFLLGYVPDNDGDRGNIVYIDPDGGRGHILQAQEVFALTCLSELACARMFGKGGNTPQAVVVNGPSSLRINEIAESFGAKLFRAEVGEANVVSLARRLRNEGFTVRILGEGSNGGTITHPSAVRDPLNTIMALVKLLRLQDADGKTPGHLWFELRGDTPPVSGSLALSHILESLPKYQTTPTGEARAKYRVPAGSHNLLKSRYESVFTERWGARPDILNSLGISAYRFVNYEGTERREGPGNRSGEGRGGFSVEFLNDKGQAKAFVWMRGSGTEPVFRLMADVPGDREDTEVTLLEWHRGILDAAIESGA
ncbi:hypothetical protein B4O97_06110 [Marispirochaeta aestuarii]|uniref:Phosphoglucomutase n=1 Tax=Marispirochaeta aestuarii TaxID=1963862 RepID=A0A1Y1S0C1_9SPIO|nr:hypothetical protein [Marispirochaeta aestuarii]ORC36636.1 hypothetical protein B4O97_06110 [Marispirochaeta aestuarii]